MKSKLIVVAVAVATAYLRMTGVAADFRYQIVALSGGTAPGTGAPFYSFDSQPGINNQGQVIFSASVNNAFTQGIWAGLPGNLSLVAVENGVAPGLPGVQFDSFGNSMANLTLADDGRVLLMAALKNGGVGTGNNLAMYVGLPGALQLVMRKGSPAPGTALNFIQPSSTGVSSFYGTWLRENGVVAFGAQLDGAATGTNDQNGLWAGTAGALQPVVMSGQPTAYGNLMITRTGQVNAGLRQDGTMYFSASTGSGASAVWRGDAGGLTRLVVQGGPAPGTALNFTTDPQRSFINVGFFGPNRLYFQGTLATLGGSITNGEFWGNPNGLSLLTQSGDPSPQIPGTTLYFLQRGYFNTNGSVLAIANLVPGSGVVSSNDQAIYYGTSPSLETWRLVMREGTVAPGTGGAFFDFGVLPDYVSFNDFGTVAFYNRLKGAGIGSTNQDSLWMWSPQTEQLSMVARGGMPIDFGGGVVRTPLLLSFRGGDGRPGGLTSGLNDKGQMVFEVLFNDFSYAIVIATASPRLVVLRSANQINISWPDTFTGYTLQQADNLKASPPWMNVTNTVQQSGGSFNVTVNANATNRFYRLIQ